MVHPYRECCQIPTLGLASHVEEQAAIPVDKEKNISKTVKDGIFYMKVVVLSAIQMETRRRRRSRRCPRRKESM